MWFLFILLVQLTSTEPCTKEVIKYQIARFSANFQTTKEIINSTTISNHEPAYYIESLGPLKQLCKGSLNIPIKSTHLWISEAGLEEIQPGTFDNQNISDQLRLGGNKLKIIQTGTFKNLNITNLELNNNEIQVIEDKAFDNLPNLLTISLGSNELTTISPSMFQATPQVRFLGINNNKFKKLSNKMFSFMNHKEPCSIGAQQNEIEEIEPAAFIGIKLYFLYIGNNKVKKLPEEMFKQHKELRVLSAENNQLTSLPKEMFSLNILYSINVENNTLGCEDIKKLKLYRELNMKHKFEVRFNDTC